MKKTVLADLSAAGVRSFLPMMTFFVVVLLALWLVTRLQWPSMSDPLGSRGGSGVVPANPVPSPAASIPGAARVSAKVAADPLPVLRSRALAMLAKQSSFRIEGPAPAGYVSAGPDGEPLELALARILEGYNYLVAYSASAPGAVSVVYVVGLHQAEPAGAWHRDLRLTDASLATRLSALRELEQLLDQQLEPSALAEVTSSLGIALQDHDQSLRLESVELLSRVPDAATSRALLEQALADPNVAVREAAVEVMATLPTPAAIDLLEVALADLDPRVREDVVDGLAGRKNERASALLEQARNDLDAGVRDAAAHARGLDR